MVSLEKLVASPGAVETTKVDLPDGIDADYAQRSRNDSWNCLVLTHGAGGNHRAAAMNYLQAGSLSSMPVLRFSGPMNLKARTKQFRTACEQVKTTTEKLSIVGGRSMGARAALALRNASPDLVHPRVLLHSFPLVGQRADDKSREQLLLDAASDTQILFVTGSGDNMCPIQKLNEVRKRMQAKSWLIVAENANHGMDVKGGKKATEAVGIRIGELVGEWLLSEDLDVEKTEASISYDKGKVVWSDWRAAPDDTTTRKADEEESDDQPKSKRQRTK